MTILLLVLIVFPCIAIKADQPGQLVIEPIFKSKVYLEEHGTGNTPTLVLVHGTGDLGAKIWASTIKVLKDRFHIISFDLPGFGRSQQKNELYSPKNYARFLKWVIDTYAKSPVVLIGHSMGGAIALYYAGLYPAGLSHLVLVDAAGILHRAALSKIILDSYLTGELNIGRKNVMEKPLSALKNIINNTIESVEYKLMPENVDPLLNSETFRQSALNGDPKLISGMALVYTDFSSVLYNVAVPTTIIWGEKDEIAPLRTAELLACSVEQSSLHIISGLGHSPMLQDPKTFNSILLSALLNPLATPFPKMTNRLNPATEFPAKIIENRNNLQISGHYASILVKNSTKVTLTKVTAERVKIDNSDVVIENSLINGREFALEITNSVVNLTGVQLSADTGIKAYSSNIDIAGSTLKGNKRLIASDYKTNVVFSVSKVESPELKGYAHEVITLYEGETF